jgi:hypothetical protein
VYNIINSTTPKPNKSPLSLSINNR